MENLPAQILEYAPAVVVLLLNDLIIVAIIREQLRQCMQSLKDCMDKLVAR